MAGISIGQLSAVCRSEHLTAARFELCSAGTCTPAASVSVLSGQANGTRVVVRGGVALAAGVTRVRFLFADWPVVALRDTVTGLPALPFDMGVAAGALPPPRTAVA